MREDIQKVLQEYEISTFLFKSNIEEAEKLLNENEKIILVLTTNFNIICSEPEKNASGSGVVFVTDKRMILYYKPLHEGIADIVQLKDIDNIKLLPNVINNGNHLQVYTQDKSYDFTVVPKQKAFKLSSAASLANAVNKIYNAFLSAVNKENKKDTENSSDIPEQIEKLSELRDKGILTDEEFQTKKTELLSRI